MAKQNPSNTGDPTAESSLKRLSKDEAKRVVRLFLEDEPLLKPLKLVFSESIYGLHDLWPERIQIACGIAECKLLPSTTWEYQEGRNGLAVYKCFNCRNAISRYWLELNPLETNAVFSSSGGPTGRNVDVVLSCEIVKVGQWPVWSPKLSTRLLKSLGPSAPLFKRGVACLQEGFGIGASAYFRRVIEEEVKALLDLIEKAAKLEGDAGALENIQKARLSQSASERLGLAVQKVPATLRPGGANPLAVLYGALSGAVHQEPEEKALITAQRLMKTLVFLFEELKERMATAEEYAAELQSISSEAAAAKGRSG